jgi:hypothetical protein
VYIIKSLFEACLRTHGVGVQPGSFCPAKPIKTQRPDLWLYRSQPKLVTILPGLTRRTVEICNHQTSICWHPSILLPSQPVTVTAVRKMQGQELRTAPQAEKSSASSSEKGRRCIQCVRTAAAAKQVSPAKSDCTVSPYLELCDLCKF